MKRRRREKTRELFYFEAIRGFCTAAVVSEYRFWSGRTTLIKTNLTQAAITLDLL